VDITAYLDHPLDGYRRVNHMTRLATTVAARDAGVVFDDLLDILGSRALTGEDLRLLHVLLSHIHHAHPRLVDGQLDAEQRDLITTVWQLTRTPDEEGGDHRVL